MISVHYYQPFGIHMPRCSIVPHRGVMTGLAIQLFRCPDSAVTVKASELLQ